MPKRVLQGRVVQTATEKTIRVRVERKYRHPLYGKYVRSSKQYLAHDENNTATIGEMVRIEETRPISKRKSWRIIERIGGKGASPVPENAADDTSEAGEISI